MLNKKIREAIAHLQRVYSSEITNSRLEQILALKSLDTAIKIADELVDSTDPEKHYNGTNLEEHETYRAVSLILRYHQDNTESKIPFPNGNNRRFPYKYLLAWQLELSKHINYS